jgi:hypothetical protein
VPTWYGDALVYVRSLTVLLLLSTLATACSGRPVDEVGPPVSTATAPRLLPSPAALPALGAKPQRTTAAGNPVWLPGSSYEQAYPNQRAEIVGSSCLLLPHKLKGVQEFSHLAYALYDLNLPGGWDGAPALQLRWAETVSLNELSVGLANWDTGRWDWYACGQTGGVQPPSLAPYTHHEGCRVIAAVVIDGAGFWELSRITLGNEAPYGELQLSGAASGSAPLTVELVAANVFDTDGTVMEYRWDFDGDSVEDTVTPVPSAGHTFEIAGSYQPAVYIVDDIGGSRRIALDTEIVVE